MLAEDVHHRLRVTLGILEELHDAVAGTQRGLDGVGDPISVLLADDDPIHHDGDVVVLIAVQ